MTIGLNPFSQSPTTRVRWIPEISSELLPRFQKQATDLALVDRARTEGLENRPDKTDQQLDTAQQEVGAIVTEGVHSLRQFLLDKLHLAKEAILARVPVPISVPVCELDTRAAVQKAKLENAEHLASMVREVLSKRRQLNKFRADNGPLPDASYAPHPIIPLAVLFSITALEMGANAGLFAKANSLGYIGGAFQAFIFSLVNVSLGFCAGFLGLRFITHVRIRYQVLGISVFAITASAGAYWNVKIARLRDQLEHDPNTHFVANASSMMPSFDWLSLSTVESWALLFLGVAVFVIAMLEGRGGRTGFVDPYPGYRAVHLASSEAEAEYITLKNDYRAAVQAAIVGARENLRRRIGNDATRVAETGEIADAALVRAQEVHDTIAEWIALGSSLLSLYRQENIRVRTAPPPEYFSVYPCFEQISDALPDASEIQKLAREADRRYAENIAAFAQADAELASLAHEESERFPAEMDAIEERVEARFVTERYPHEIQRITALPEKLGRES